MILAPVGAGKTALTLTAMRDMLRAGAVQRFLVVAPKRVAESVWPKENKLWTPELSLSVATGTPAQRVKALHANVQIVVATYDNLQWLAEQRLQFDGVVFDELTRLKNPSGKRFKAMLKILDVMRIRWGLTGSFTSNGLEDVFGQCKVIDQTLLGRSKGAFLQQYFHCINRDYGDWEPRADALPMVMDRIKPATYVLDAGEYRDKLPPLHIVEMRCTMEMWEYKAMKRDFMVQFSTAQAVAANAGVVTGKLQQMSSGFVYDTRTTPSDKPGKFTTTKSAVWFSNHKFEALADLLAENQHANTIIAYQYQEELAELQRRYPRAVTLDDPDAIDRWNAGKVKLLLVHPKSAGHGLNLQFGGCHMVFLSLPWSLELFEQTIGRLHRSGQRHEVWVYVLLTEDTIDEKIYVTLHDKRSLSDLAMEALK
jgi:SNF2 family DNA or RNA helicase